MAGFWDEDLVTVIHLKLCGGGRRDVSGGKASKKMLVEKCFSLRAKKQSESLLTTSCRTVEFCDSRGTIISDGPSSNTDFCFL